MLLSGRMLVAKGEEVEVVAMEKEMANLILENSDLKFTGFFVVKLISTYV